MSLEQLTTANPQSSSEPYVRHAQAQEYPPGSEALLQERAEIAQNLCEAGQLSHEFIESGKLDCFAVNPAVGGDAFKHILIGDIYGGAHHLPSIMSEGMPRRDIASAIVSPHDGKSLGKLRQDQKIRPTKGDIFQARHVLIEDKEDKVFIEYKKPGGSVFFPNEWTAENVLDAIIEVAQQPSANDTEQRFKSDSHLGVVNGVTLVVYTDPRTNRILGAHPK